VENFVTISIEVLIMKVKNMVVKRILDLCGERGITLNELANRSGVTPSTVYSIMDQDRRNISIVTIKTICDGFEITLGEFFSTEEFDNLPQEIE
jgi:transcriptional regulator with XRE-family HTH domain